MGKSMWVGLIVFLSSLVMSPNAYAKGPKMNCPPVDAACGKQSSKNCHYKLKAISEMKDGNKLDVGYPPSVFDATMDTKKGEDDTYDKDKQFTIVMKKGQNPKKDETYIMTRCPENEYTIKKKAKDDKDTSPEEDPESK